MAKSNWQEVSKAYVESLHPHLTVKIPGDEFHLVNHDTRTKPFMRWPSSALTFIIPLKWRVGKNGMTMDPLKPFRKVGPLVDELLPDHFRYRTCDVLFGNYTTYRLDSDFTVTEPKDATDVFIRMKLDKHIEPEVANHGTYSYYEDRHQPGDPDTFWFLVYPLDKESNYHARLLVETCQKRLERRK